MKRTTQNPAFRIFASAMLLAVLTASGIAADANVASQYSDKPIGITWDTSITQSAAMDYMIQLGEDHAIDLPWMQNEQTKEQIQKYRDTQKEIETADAKGNIFFLKKGIIPSFARVGFRTVADQAEFKKVILQRRLQYGGDNERVSLEGNDDQYTLIFKWGEEEGQGISTYYRLDNGIMYDASFEDVFEMNLPAPSYLKLSGSRAKYDVLAEFNFKEIPKGYKDLAWNLLSAQSGPMLQQFDDEEDDVYDMRRAAGDLMLNSIKPLIFDIERADFELELIENGQPLKFDLNLAVRANSPLSKTLSEAAKGTSRFSGILNDDAALTMASTWNMPEGIRKLGKASAGFLKAQADKDTNAPDEARAAARQLAAILEATCKKEKIDAFAKFGLDSGGEFVFYGAMKMDGTENMVQLLPQLLALIPEAGASEQQTENGTVFTLQIPEEFWRNDMGVPTEVRGLFPSRLNFTFARTAMWFTIGREQSTQKIDEVIASAMTRAVNPAGGEQLLLNIDMTEWANADSSSKPHEAMAKVELMLDNMMSQSIQVRSSNRRKKNKNKKDDPAAEEVEAGSSLFKPNDDSRSFVQDTLATDGFARIFLNTGKKSIHLNGEVGDGLARYVMVRYLVTINRAMRQSQDMMEESAKAAEALKETAIETQEAAAK